jgi:cytochrome P450
MLLATHQEIQDRVAAELKEVFFSEDVEISYESIVKLEYLERVIKESLRLCPVVPSKRKQSKLFCQMPSMTQIVPFSLQSLAERRRRP